MSKIKHFSLTPCAERRKTIETCELLTVFKLADEGTGKRGRSSDRRDPKVSGKVKITSLFDKITTLFDKITSLFVKITT